MPLVYDFRRNRAIKRRGKRREKMEKGKQQTLEASA